MTTALVFGFAQYGELFIASLAAWIGVCSFAARGTRNYSAYGFQLAGYTAAIVGLPAALNTSGAYTLIVARSTEITLGIVCAGLVSRLIFPVHLAPKLIALASQLFHRVDPLTQNSRSTPREIRSSSPRKGRRSPRTSERSRRCAHPRFSRAPRRAYGPAVYETRRMPQSTSARSPKQRRRILARISRIVRILGGSITDASRARGSRNGICASARRGRAGLARRPGSAC